MHTGFANLHTKRTWQLSFFTLLAGNCYGWIHPVKMCARKWNWAIQRGCKTKKNMDITIGNSIPVCVQILTTELLSVCKKNWNRLSSWDWLSRLFEKNDNRFGNKTWLLWHFLWHTLRVIDSDIEVIVIIVNVSSICYIQLVCLQLCFHIWNGRQMKMHGCTDVIRFQVHGRYAFNRWTVGDIRQSGQSYRDEVRMYYLTSDSGGAP